MGIQKVLLSTKNNSFIKSAIIATALTCSSLGAASAQNINTKNYKEDTIELVNKFDKSETKLQERNMPLGKGLALLFGSAIGLVGTAIFCAWEPKDKNRFKS